MQKPKINFKIRTSSYNFNMSRRTCFRVESITEKRIKRWALSMEDLVSDATGKWLSLLLCKVLQRYAYWVKRRDRSIIILRDNSMFYNLYC